MSKRYLLDPTLVVEKASNIQSSLKNPPFSKDEFLAFYPQFTGKVPDIVLEAYIGMANACLSIERWNEQWQVGMSLYVAHFITLYLTTMDDPTAPASKVIAASKGAMGIPASKSVGDVSISYDYSYLSTVSSWSSWLTTTYGQQFVTLAKLMGKGGMYVY